MSVTLVTGLWNIKRDSLTEGWSRSFEHYLEKFDQLLKVENNMIIFLIKLFIPFWNQKRTIMQRKLYFRQHIQFQRMQ